MAEVATLQRKTGSTLFMVLLGTFQLLLSRYSRQDEVCVGSPYAGRDHAATRDIVGYFVNTLAILVDTSGDLTVTEVVARVRTAVLGAFEHADVSFAALVGCLKVRRDASRSAVFQAMFAVDAVAGLAPEMVDKTVQ